MLSLMRRLNRDSSRALDAAASRQPHCKCHPVNQADIGTWDGNTKLSFSLPEALATPVAPV